MNPRIIWLDSCASTNSELADRVDAAGGTVVATHCQTAGRGQRGNSWEAEPGNNLTFSMLLRPQVLTAPRQFEVSMLVALAIKDALDAAFAEVADAANAADTVSGTVPLRASVKWPNDIYVGTDKICGTLIENKLAGAAIERAIVGVGINVNQRHFVSDAPNPTSMAILTGREFDLETLLDDVTLRIEGALAAYEAEAAPIGAAAFLPQQALHDRYMAALIRTEGTHRFAEAASGEIIEGHITDVALDGMLTLTNGRQYAFKEIIYL